MFVPEKLDSVVVIAEKSAGNEVVGDMWLETAIFSSETSAETILRWAAAKNCSGKVILTVPDTISEDSQ